MRPADRSPWENVPLEEHYPPHYFAPAPAPTQDFRTPCQFPCPTCREGGQQSPSATEPRRSP